MLGSWARLSHLTGDSLKLGQAILTSTNGKVVSKSARRCVSSTSIKHMPNSFRRAHSLHPRVMSTLGFHSMNSPTSSIHLHSCSPSTSSVGQKRQFHVTTPVQALKKDPYEVLGLDRNATKNDIKKSYYKLVKK